MHVAGYSKLAHYSKIIFLTDCRCHVLLHNTASIHLGIPTRLLPLLGSLLSVQLPKAPDEWAVALRTPSQRSVGTGRAFASRTAAIEGRVLEHPQPNARVPWTEFSLYLLPVCLASQHHVLFNSMLHDSHLLEDFQCTYNDCEEA